MSPEASLAHYERDQAQSERASEGVEQGIVDDLMDGKVLRRRWSTISASLLIQYAGGPEMFMGSDDVVKLATGSITDLLDLQSRIRPLVESLCREWLKTNSGQSEIQERVNEAIEDRA